jgi:hypothetical protein
LSKFFVFFAILSATLAGCASATVTYGPDGRQSHSINCSGLANTWGACLEKAGEICGAKGYDVLTSAGDQGVFVQGTSSTTSAQASGGSVITRNMLIACKP